MAISAMAALSLLLLRPACDIVALHLEGAEASALAFLHYPSEPGAAPGVGPHDSGPAAIAGTAKGLPLSAAPMIPGLAPPVLAFLFLVTALRAAPPPSRSYYARSARILR